VGSGVLKACRGPHEEGPAPAKGPQSPCFRRRRPSAGQGLWKRFKHCEHCLQIVVERAKWKNFWDSIRFWVHANKTEH
jgi:hypothetical protein